MAVKYVKQPILSLSMASVIALTNNINNYLKTDHSKYMYIMYMYCNDV